MESFIKIPPQTNRDIASREIGVNRQRTGWTVTFLALIKFWLVWGHNVQGRQTSKCIYTTFRN